MNILSALWIMISWRFSTRASVATMLNVYSCFFQLFMVVIIFLSQIVLPWQVKWSVIYSWPWAHYITLLAQVQVLYNQYIDMYFYHPWLIQSMLHIIEIYMNADCHADLLLSVHQMAGITQG